MQDRAFDSPMDQPQGSWDTHPAESEMASATEGTDPRGTSAVIDDEAAASASHPAPSAPAPAAPPVPVGEGVLPASTVEAGEFTRGRRRDLEAGATNIDVLKIVYWGPGRSGKTTNLKWLHGRLRPELRGRLISLDGPGERTLYFDCLPLDLTPSGASPIRLRLYTVPGQPRFRLTRKLVLQGVDGIVFVWDSRSRRLNANLASLIEMRETLAELGIPWHEIPRVVQYNKLDRSDRIPPEQLDHVLDRMGERGPRVLSVATRGTGVLDTLGAIARAALKRRRERGRKASWADSPGF